MNIRRAAPFVFAALCVGLSAFVLRGQITAHPKPPPVPEAREPSAQNGPTNSGRPVDPKTWHISMGPAQKAARMAVGNQLAAINAGDVDRAWFYQSRGLHRNFRSGQAFLAEIKRNFPEFGHAKSAVFGPVWTDATGDHADVIVTVRGQNGNLARGYYWLIQEDGGYKVASVRGGQTIK